MDNGDRNDQIAEEGNLGVSKEGGQNVEQP